jgi:hypothetical protein
MKSKRASKGIRGATLGTIGLALVLAGSGCLESSTELETAASPTSLPTIDTFRASVEMSDAQASKLAPVVERWHQAEASRGVLAPGVSPVMEFLAESSGVLGREQLIGVIRVVREQAAQRFADGERPQRFQGRRGPHGPGDGMGRRDRMGPRGGMGEHGPFAELGLSDEQKETLQNEREAFHGTLKDLHEQRDNGSLTQEEFEQAVRDARDVHREAVQAILTEEQLAQLEAFQLERLVARIERQIERHDDGSERRLELLTQILSLEPAQVEAIREIQAAVVPQLETILAGLKDESLSVEDARSALKDLREATHAAVVAELTEEQAALLEELKSMRHWRGRRGPRA